MALDLGHHDAIDALRLGMLVVKAPEVAVFVEGPESLGHLILADELVYIG